MENLKNHYQNLRSSRHAPLLLASLMFGTVSLATLSSFPSTPLFPNTTQFALFATESISLENNVTISSGDLGANKKIETKKNDTINGNQYSKKLVAIIPNISPFTIGNQDKTFSSSTNTLLQGNYKNITVEKDSTLTLSGVYNLNSLELKENAKLIFNSPTTLNLQKLKSEKHTTIINGTGAKFDDLHINLLNQKKEKEDGNEIQFGKNSFLNFILTAPNTDVKISKDTTLRGQVLAKSIEVEKNGIISREEGFERESDEGKVVVVDGLKFTSNEIVLVFDKTNSSFLDAVSVASQVGGVITGDVVSQGMYKIEVPTNTAIQLNEVLIKINTLKQPPLQSVTANFIMDM